MMQTNLSAYRGTGILHLLWCWDEDLDCEHQIVVKNGKKCGVPEAGHCVKGGCEA